MMLPSPSNLGDHLEHTNHSDPTVALLSFLLANTTLMFIAHNRHDKLSEHTNRKADELREALGRNNPAETLSLQAQLHTLFRRYYAALWAFILFSIEELMLFTGLLYDLDPSRWVFVLFIPVFFGLIIHICFDLGPAAKVTKENIRFAKEQLAAALPGKSGEKPPTPGTASPPK